MRSSPLRSWLRRLDLRLAVILALAAELATLAAGCSLGNVKHDDCSSSSQCADTFGLGSTCADGFCTDPATCATGHDCREKFGGGACVGGICATKLPPDPACFTTEPEGLFDKKIVGDDSYTIIGGVASMYQAYDKTVMSAARLAVREINSTGGGIAGRRIGLVLCDNEGSPPAPDAQRQGLNEHAVDYLAGTLGAPVILGPLSSGDAIFMVNRVLAKKLPTVIISPSATSPALTDQPDRLSPADPYGLFWRTCPSDTLQGAVLAKDVLGPDATITGVAVIYAKDPYGNGLRTVFTSLYAGKTTTTLIPFDSGGDFTSIATLADQSGANAVLIISVIGQDTVGILKALVGKPIAKSAKFFFTDGSKDKGTLLDPTLPQEVKNMILGADLTPPTPSMGTAPAQPSGPNYDIFKASMLQAFQIGADSFSFLAQSYDAAYVASYGLVYAQSKTSQYDGRTLAEGLANLSKGAVINVGPNDWPAAKTTLTTGAHTIDITGVSGALDFDPKTGEAPAPIEVWTVKKDFSDFATVKVY